MTDVVADFFGRFAIGASQDADLVEGRIVMNREQIVLAIDQNTRTTISLSSVVDVTVGHVPPEFEGFFDDTVTIAFENDDRRRTVLIEGDGDTIEKFVVVLLKCLLNGVEVLVRHPARIGGRVTDNQPRPAYLQVEKRAVGFEAGSKSHNGGGGGRFTIGITDVVEFDRTTRTFDDEKHPALLVKHLSEGRTITTSIVPPSGRVMNILGRHLRLEYDDVRAEIAEVSLTEAETEALVALHTTGGDVDIASVLSGDATEINAIVHSLREKELIVDGEAGTNLTPKGRVLVTERIEQVNV